MRLLLAALAWVVCVGGVALWTSARTAVGSGTPPARAGAEGVFTVEATVSFAAEPDLFALETEGEKAAALRVTVNGAEVLRAESRVLPGRPLVSAPAPAVFAGRNELFVQAHPPQRDLARSHAVRIRVLRDGEPVAERTFWTVPGTPLAETFPLDIPAAAAPGDAHGH
ncbi:MAG: hypothetical protein HUU15_01615 [Candidatus Brocadiae bacterium]|nr:hypothetical protein [Candidatus Brocadiia bacterium]